MLRIERSSGQSIHLGVSREQKAEVLPPIEVGLPEGFPVLPEEGGVIFTEFMFRRGAMGIIIEKQRLLRQKY